MSGDTTPNGGIENLYINRFAELRLTRQSGVEADIVRKNLTIWTAKEGLVLTGKNDAVVIARAASAVREAIGNLLASAGSFVASRVRTKERTGKSLGLFDIKVVAENTGAFTAGLARLNAAGFFLLQSEEAFCEDSCCTVLVPKAARISPLIASMVNLSGVSAVGYWHMGGMPGAGQEMARAIFDVTIEELVPRHHRWRRRTTRGCAQLPLAGLLQGVQWQSRGQGMKQLLSSRPLLKRNVGW